MKSFLLPLFLGALLASCTPALIIKKEDLQRVPKGTTKVVAVSDMTADSVFKFVSRSFARSGCPVSASKESMQVVCNGKAVEGGTLMRAMAYIEPHSKGSIVTFTGEWGLNSSGQIFLTSMTGVSGVTGTEQVVWRGIDGTKSAVVFQYLIAYAIDIPNHDISYEK